MKAILISIRPKWVAKILNGDKIAEVRRNAPKEWIRYLHGKGPKPEPCEVYIYCTKNKLHYSVGALVLNKDDCFKRSVDGTYKYGDSVELMGYSPDYPYDKNNFLNGKVVAKFMLNEVEEFADGSKPITDFQYILRQACLTKEETIAYKKEGKPLYAWHISDLQIFDKPKELSDFRYWGCLDRVKQAPQSWCYVEEKE